VLGALTAVAVAGSVYRIPIQVSESLESIERVVTMPSAGAVFVDGFRNSPTMLRPLKEARVKLLVQLAERLGGRFHLVFRGYHALAGAILIGLFVWICGRSERTEGRSRRTGRTASSAGDRRAETEDGRSQRTGTSWNDVTALAFGLAVLTGMHTFVGLFREAFPVNHFLIVAICVLATFAVAQTRGGWLADLVAVALLAIAALSFESGLLVWPAAAAAYASGLRGISRRGLVAMTIVLVIYAGARRYFLSYETLGVGQRATGWGAGVLTPDEQRARFGANPAPFYAYNVTTAAASVLVSQPQIGRFTVINAWNSGDVTPVYYVQIGSSLFTSALIAWYVFGRGPSGRRRWREPVPLVFLTLLGVSALMSYTYAKDEILSAAGVFYAIAAVAAARSLFDLVLGPTDASRRTSSWRAALVVLVALAVSSAWAIRSAGLHLRLRHGAFEARTAWASVLYPTNRPSWPTEPHTLQVVSRMRDEVLMQRTVAPAMLPRWTDRWWGED
jgi:hypothetical protein